VHRFDRPTDYFVYPLSLEERFPSILIPLLPEDGDVTVEFQEIFDRAYDAGPYRKQIDYTGDPPPPPFADERKMWIRNLIDS